MDETHLLFGYKAYLFKWITDKTVVLEDLNNFTNIEESSCTNHDQHVF